MNGWNRVLAFLLSVSCVLCGTAEAAEQPLTANLSVSAVVVSNCRFTVEPLAFGSYDPMGAHSGSNLEATATLVLTCTRDSHATIVMDGGRNAGPGLSRGLALGTDRLDYQIYRDSARTQVWGRGADSLSVLAQGLRVPSELVVYGRIPGGQEVAAGNYTDVITATVDF